MVTIIIVNDERIIRLIKIRDMFRVKNSHELKHFLYYAQLTIKYNFCEISKAVFLNFDIFLSDYKKNLIIANICQISRIYIENINSM